MKISRKSAVQAVSLFMLLFVTKTEIYGGDVMGPFDPIIIADDEAAAADTIPIRDRYGDFITEEYYNPFDITPSIVEQTVEYDMETGQYVVMEKIGDQYYRTPTYLTMEEYLNWQQEQQEKDHIRKLSGAKSLDFSKSFKVDPMSEIDIEALLTDRLFGGTEISIEPRGNVDITMGVDMQTLDGLNITEQNRRTGGFNFDMDINMGVDGKIGEKMNLGFDYNTQATFDFDNQLNLGYLSDAFDEDGIIKTIEAGNISFPLRSQLIQGSQDLFGLKTELQFGDFSLTAIASQSRSEAETISLENGKLIQEFELRPDEYDENRHFFISHYNRENFESALSTIPQVRSLMRITNIEVWVTSEPNDDLQNATTVAAISYLGESDLDNFSDPGTMWQPTTTGNPLYLDVDGNQLPDNDNSALFGQLVNDEETRKIINTSTFLRSRYGLNQVRDFEVQSMRKLRPSEFTFYPELGFISLNVRLQPNQVLGVAYEYTYSLNGSEVYKVGELTNESNTGALDDEGNPEPEDVVYVKMLKSSNQRVDLPSWDLMMKNIYSLSSSQLSEEDFQLDIFFEDNATATLKRFIPEEGFNRIPLLDLFQLDRLNSRLDPQQDGIFDFIPGITVNSRTGSIIFPVLEPFGNSLRELLNNDQTLYDKYGFPELYDNTVIVAREQLEKNRFLIKGQLKSNFSSEISLGAFNIPQGSVTVRAGSQILREGIDYDIDYGIGRIKILNEAYLQQGVPIKVSFEDQNLFGLQQKTMFGLRGEYEVSDNLIIGGTYMRLFERPFTQKVNIGDDPINNRMFGLDMNYTAEAPFLTRLVDKLPFYSTNAESTLSLSAEVAAIKPGASGAINVPGEDKAVVSLDDFEGASSSIPLGTSPTRWTISSTPSRFRESLLANDLTYGVNRALTNWYVVNDFNVRSEADQADSYTRRIDQTELFERQLDLSQIPDLFTFDVNYFPSERGPYNFDVPGGTPFSAGISVDPATNNVVLNDPESRWGGIMRYIDGNNDFQAANIEYIEFWMLNPYMDRRDGDHSDDESGTIFFHLGNVSEDILKDNLQFYENSIPLPEENIPTQNTVWGEIPLSIPSVDAFDRTNSMAQDRGFDGIDDTDERAQFREYIDNVNASLGLVDLSDPSNDNFVSYLDERYSNEDNLLNRFKRFNNPQGNVATTSNRIGLGNPEPDAEDLNGNRSLETSESYYQYRIDITNANGELRRSPDDYITDERVIRNPSTQEDEKWYRFRIPLNEGVPINDIQGFRSIQFIRMVMTDFETPKTFRMAEFELVRNQWRRLPLDEECLGDLSASSVDFVIDEVGIQENSQKTPFNYVLPEGIKQERFVSTFSNILQDENSMNVRICGLPDSCEAMVYKLTEFDMRLYEQLQLFVHAEARDAFLEDEELSAFIRIGRDFKNNYYEYEIPLTLSDTTNLIGNMRSTVAENQAYAAEVWREENMFDFPLSLFTDAKIQRNLEGFDKTAVWTAPEGDPNNERARVRIKGNPTLGLVKGIVLGLRSNKGREETICADVWFNELRLKGLNNRGGTAGIARVDMQLADLGNLTMSGNFSTIGFGQIDQQIQERQLDHVTEYDVATNLELGKFFPDNWGLSIPFYYQYAKSVRQAEFDPYELDLRVDTLKTIEGYPDIEDIDERSKERTTIQTVNFTNVRKAKTNAESKPKPWDISNVSVSYAHTKTTYSDAILKEEVTTDQRGDLSYNYSNRAKPIQPFKGVKPKALRFVKEFNFNPIPNSVSFNTQLRRLNNRRFYRLPDPQEEGIEYAFDDKRFDWTRNYGLQWDLAKSLKVNFDANASAVVDELRQIGVAPTIQERDWANEYGENVTEQVNANPDLVNSYRNENLRNLGRLKNYNQGLSVNWTVPFKYIPGMDWITARASYNAEYIWNAGSLSLIDLIEPEYDGFEPWHTIQNSQNRTINSTFSFEKLYDKVGYLKKLQSTNSRSSRRSSRSRGGDEEDGSRKKDREITAIEKILVRPILSIRELKFTYRENLSTVVPGFANTPDLLGMSGSSPGWGFVFGMQPDLNIQNNNNWLTNAANQGWITPSRFQNQQVLQNNTQNYEARLKVEPWRDFDIDFKFNKTYSRNHAEDFVNRATPGSGEIDLQQVALRDLGSYEVTYFALGTLFDDDINSLFKRFESHRAIISNRLPNEAGAGGHPIDQGYAEGYGRQHVDVLIPAFIAAYTNEDPETVSLDLTDQISGRGYIPKPNWSLRYNGLSKLPWFKDLFSNVTITHGYTSTLAVNSYQTDLQYDPTDQYYIDPDISTKNYFARFEIPEVILEERFQPIIGVDFKTVGNLAANFEYSRSRSLQLSTGLGQINERRSTEYTAGLGWILDDVNIAFLTGQRNSRSRRSNRNDAEEDANSSPQETPNNRGGNNETFQRKLQMNFDFSIRDDATYTHEFDSGRDAQATRGTYSLQISPSIDYDINKYFTLRMFVDYNQTKPKTLGGYDVTNINGGLTARFNLQ